MPTLALLSSETLFIRTFTEVLEGSSYSIVEASQAELALGDAKIGWVETKLRMLLIEKPVTRKELLESLERLRCSSSQLPQRIALGCHYDTVRRALIGEKGEITPLTEKESALLEVLLAANGAEISRESLLFHVWNYAENVDTHTLETHMYRLRAKLKAALGDNEAIQTTPEGYVLRT